MDSFSENNKVTLTGRIEEDPVFSHDFYGENFYTFKLITDRLSETSDRIPVILSEKFLYTNDLSAGNTVEVTGQFRSYNNYTDIGNRLVLSVFARNITPVSSPEEAENPNAIQLTGYICKAPVYRTTPFGREITDLLIAVNRAYNKSDYIPCIAWGLNAKYASVLSVGEKLRLTGRIQSREYKKKYDDETIETKTAYEVSISRLESIS